MEENHNPGKTGITRRGFIKGAGVSILALSLNTLKLRGLAAADREARYAYRSWEDIYRKQWTWDRVVRGSHAANCGQQIHCLFDIYVKNGVVFREEQAGAYVQTNPQVPDFNPRGCQKGCSYSQRMYDPTRIKYPLKRVGKRGEGKWKRVSWEDALTEIADTILDTIKEDGPDSVIFSAGTHGALIGVQGMGHYRLGHLLDAPRLTINPEIGDHYPGLAVTLGKIMFHCSGDDWFYSDLILIWGGNPLYTQIPNSHFFLEARYNGARLIVITPDYTPAATHADLWLPVNPGGDPALALSMAQVILEERLYNEPFVKEQTDLPLLVREDTRKFLRQRDLKKDGAEDVLYAFDAKGKRIREMPRGSLRLKEIDPALEGEYEVETLKGRVKVRPVFQTLKERLEEYTPEKASRIAGIHPEAIRRVAREMAKARAVANVTNQGFGKYYHGDLMERSILLLFALCGHFGKKGSGFNGITAWSLAEGAFLCYNAPTKPSLMEAAREIDRLVEPTVKRLKKNGYSDEMIVYELSRDPSVRESYPSGVLFFYLHGGIGELSNEELRKWDPHLKRAPREYIDEALKKKWQYLSPPLGKDPKVFIQEGGNMLRRVRGYPKLIEKLLPKLKLLVNIDFRMSNSGLYSDFVLPCPGYYEKYDLGVGQVIPNPPIINQAVKPLWESRPEWEIHCLLAKKIQERASEKGVLSFRDKRGQERRLDRIYEDLTFERSYTERDIEKLIDDAMKVGKTAGGLTWKDLKQKGSARVAHVGRTSLAMGNATDIKPDETITPHTWHVQKKIPWPTFTRRIQFYIDHDLYLELGEELPTHKDSIKAGGDYPLQMTGGHTRWSIHTVWRDNAYMLRLQRGGPAIYLSLKDAQARGIQDGDRVKVWNDLGSFEVHAKVSPNIKPGQAVIYHAWEPYQFKEGRSHEAVIASPINPIELAGDDFHLRSVYWCFEPGGKDKDTRVEVALVGVRG